MILPNAPETSTLRELGAVVTRFLATAGPPKRIGALALQTKYQEAEDCALSAGRIQSIVHESVGI